MDRETRAIFERLVAQFERLVSGWGYDDRGKLHESAMVIKEGLDNVADAIIRLAEAMESRE